MDSQNQADFDTVLEGLRLKRSARKTGTLDKMESDQNKLNQNQSLNETQCQAFRTGNIRNSTKLSVKATPEKTTNSWINGQMSKSYRSLEGLVEPEVLSEIKSGKKGNKTLTLLSEEKIHVSVELGNQDISHTFEEAIKALGGKVNKNLTKNTTLMITNKPSCKKVQKASELGIPVVGLLWLTDSITQQSKRDVSEYCIKYMQHRKKQNDKVENNSENRINIQDLKKLPNCQMLRLIDQSVVDLKVKSKGFKFVQQVDKSQKNVYAIRFDQQASKIKHTIDSKKNKTDNINFEPSINFQKRNRHCSLNHERNTKSRKSRKYSVGKSKCQPKKQIKIYCPQKFIQYEILSLQMIDGFPEIVFLTQVDESDILVIEDSTTSFCFEVLAAALLKKKIVQYKWVCQMLIKQTYLEVDSHTLSYQIPKDMLLNRKFYIHCPRLKKYRVYLQTIGATILDECSDRAIAIVSEQNHNIPHSVTQKQFCNQLLKKIQIN